MPPETTEGRIAQDAIIPPTQVPKFSSAPDEARDRDKAIRVLHCIPTLGGGGAERQLAYLGREMAKRGVQFHVAFLHGGPNLERLGTSGVVLHPIRSHGNYDPAIIWRLRRTIRAVRPGLVQLWLPQMTVLGGMAAILADIPFIVSERSSTKSYRGTWKDWLRVHIGKRAAAIVGNSEGGREYWAGRTNRPIEVIRNGVPFDEIEATPPIPNDEARLADGAKLILYAGRFEPEKNLASLVPTLRQVLICADSAVAVLFGEGALREDVIRSAEAVDFGDRFRVMDFTTSLWRWVKRARVFVSLSLYEGNPNTVLEAAACDCPVVLSDIPQHREILDNDSAYFVPVSSPPNAAEAILRVLMNPEEARQKAERARKKIAAYSVEASVDQYLSLYARLI